MRFGKFCILALAAGSLSAQQPFTKGDVEFGGGLFRANCAVCHGPDGDFIPRADLGHGRFRRASSDQDLIAIINTGIEGTAMPGFAQVIETIEMGTVVSYLHYLASTSRSVSASGDPGRGRTLFEGRGSCLNCHRIRDKGSRVGPDLTEVGMVRREGELERSILDPDAEILPQNRFVRLLTRGGATVSGRLLNRDSFTVQLIDTHEQLRSFMRSELREFSFEAKSPMPSYKDTFSATELADVVSYLVSLKGSDKR